MINKIKQLLKEENTVHEISKIRTNFDSKLIRTSFLHIFIKFFKPKGFNVYIKIEETKDENLYFLFFRDKDGNVVKIKYDMYKLQKEINRYNDNIYNETTGMVSSANDLIQIFLGLL